jgi:DNA-binding MarR family transcriptional regulator
MKKSQEPALANENEHKLVRKWGKLNMRAGFVGFPSAVIQFQDQLRLSSSELNVLIQIADFWWDPERHPYPSKGLIAKRMQMKPRSIQRIIAQLESRKLIARIARNYQEGGNKSNEYRLTGLARAAEQYSKEIIDKFEKRSREQAQRMRRKATLHLAQGREK